MRKPIIAVKRLNVIYNKGKSNEVQALKDISFEIFPGEFVIFFGPSGCGKSTLLYSISGLETNIEGSILVNGENIARFKTIERAKFHQTTVGMVFQAYYLIPSLSVLQNVALPQLPLCGKKRTREKRAQELLERFGVGKQSHKLPSELSGGQQQRVALCRSLMNEPLIIFADEPVGNLDTKSSEDVMSLLRALNDEQKKTIILVTHDPSHLHHAHRIVYLRDGKVTDIKINTEKERRASSINTLSQAGLPLALRHWAQTITSEMVKQSPEAFAMLQAQEITTETFTGMTLSELRRLEDVTARLLLGKAKGPEEAYNVLHESLSKHGLSIDKRRARRLAKKLSDVADEINDLKRIERRASSERTIQMKAASTRTFVLRELNSELPEGIEDRVDNLIANRLSGKIDFARLAAMLDAPFKKGGAGLDRRFARKLARAIETIAEGITMPPSNSLNNT